MDNIKHTELDGAEDGITKCEPTTTKVDVEAADAGDDGGRSADRGGEEQQWGTPVEDHQQKVEMMEMEHHQREEKGQQQQQQNATGGGGAALAKLDLLSREDLIKLAKKQLVMLKDTRKQLMASKKESEEYLTQMRGLSAKMASDESFSAGNNDGMMAMELADYKSALVAARKELADNAMKMGDKETIVQELSQRIDQLQQQREEVNADLCARNAQIGELTQEIDAKSRLLSEHAKDIEALRLQLDEARQSGQEEVVTLRNEQRQAQSELAAVRRTADGRGAEVRRLRAECEMNAQLLAGIREEFTAYKERAECALAKSKEDTAVGAANGGTATSGGTVASSPEWQQLIDTLSARNAQISELSAKCSFLEEEVRSGQLHSKTLLDELNLLHDQQQLMRKQWEGERQRMVAEHGERKRAEETLRAELRKELQATREREAAAAASQQMERFSGHDKYRAQTEELQRECDRLSRELDETKALLKSTVPSSKRVAPSPVTLLSRPVHQQFPTKQHQSKPSPLNFGHSLSHHQQFNHLQHSTVPNSPEMDSAGVEEEGDGTLGTTHSESSDSLDDLHSVLQEAVDGTVPLGSGTPASSFNVAALAEHFGKNVADFAGGDVHPNLQQNFVGRTQHQEVLKLLEDCRELLRDTEEDNVRLSEQVSVLKEEIRRMERCMKRVEHLGNGVCPEYFKNIVLKFLAPPKVRDERVQLLPVLQTILHLDAVELEQIRHNCTTTHLPTDASDADETATDQTTDDGGVQAEEEGDGGWAAWIGWK